MHNQEEFNIWLLVYPSVLKWLRPLANLDTNLRRTGISEGFLAKQQQQKI